MKNEKMKIGIVSIHHLRGGGGATRLMDLIAADMAKRGHSVTIIANEGKASSKVPVELRGYPHKLLTINLDSKSGQLEAREKIAASGLDICTGTHIRHMAWLFSGSGIPFIMMGTIDPRTLAFETWRPYEYYAALFSADAVQAFLEEYIPFFPEAIKPQVKVFGNPAPPPAKVDLDFRREKKTKTLLSAGRFDEEHKRFSYLLRAFAALADDFPDWRLKLVGDGPYWEYYHILARQLGIGKLVDFTGAVLDMGQHYKEADIFCLPSMRKEGMPMVYLEASAYALPLVGYSSCISSAVMIKPDMGVVADGYGTGAVAALTASLRSLMETSPEKRAQMGINAREDIQKRYGGSIVYDEWEKLFADTLEKTQRRDRTKLELVERMKETNMGLSPQWEGLGPESPVWTLELLASAAAELTSRETCDLRPDATDAPQETEIVRLKSELARLKVDYSALEKKYNMLRGQLKHR